MGITLGRNKVTHGIASGASPAQPGTIKVQSAGFKNTTDFVRPN